VSARRYETIGRARLTFAYGLLSTLYIFGVSLPTLAAIYKRICCSAREDSISPAHAIDVHSSLD